MIGFFKGVDMISSIEVSTNILLQCCLLGKDGTVYVKYKSNEPSNICMAHPTSDFIDFTDILELIPVKNVVRDILGNQYAAKHFVLAITLECCREYGVSNPTLVLSKILDIGGC